MEKVVGFLRSLYSKKPKNSIIIASLAVVLFISIAWLIFSLTKQSDTTQPTKVTHTKPYYSKLKFAISLLRSIQKDAPKKSIFYSPHSVYRSLLFAYLVADGDTEKELKNVLGLNWVENKADIEYVYNLEKTMQINRFQNQSSEVNLADKFYISESVRISDSVKKMFGDNIEQFNFAEKPDQHMQHINQFVEEATKNHIQNFAQPNAATSETQFIMVNGVYFKWASMFNEHQNSMEMFHDQGHDLVYIAVLKRLDYFEQGVIEPLKTRLLKMPSRGENERISMFVFLPGQDTTIDKLLEKLTPNILDDAFNGVYSFEKNEVSVTFPHFSFEYESELVPALKRMGVRHLFNEYGNFSGLTDSNGSKFKTDILHKAKIEIDEAGPINLIDHKANTLLRWFHCTRPFMFVIYDELFKEILFAGIYRGPKSTPKPNIIFNKNG